MVRRDRSLAWIAGITLTCGLGNLSAVAGPLTSHSHAESFPSTLAAAIVDVAPRLRVSVAVAEGRRDGRIEGIGETLPPGFDESFRDDSAATRHHRCRSISVRGW